MNSPHLTVVRPSTVMTREQHGQPRTLRVARAASRDAAYRRLAISILGLDILSLAETLRRPSQQVAA